MALKELNQNLIFISFFLIIFSLAAVSWTDQQMTANFFGGEELSSPGDWVGQEQIKVYPNQIILDIENALWSKFTNTNSMDPFLDESTNAIEIVPENPDSINVGDIISYQTDQGVIIHRVIEKGKDEKGIYYIVKGDNNRFNDPFKVRFADVVGVVVAIIY